MAQPSYNPSMRPDELWEGKGAKERSLRALLTPLSWLYAFGWQAYLATYSLGFKRASEPHKPIFCVGSLMVGGSGKSPLTIFIANMILSTGRQVVIGCSGYGSPHSKDASLAPSGPIKASEWGDEPSMFRWLLPDVPLVVGRKRVLAAQLVHEQYPNAVLVMDDGFQHLPVKKHVKILIDDVQYGNRRCLPAGPLREPISNRKRADMIIPDDFRVVRGPTKIVDKDGSPVVPREYAVLCALGQPERFISSLQTQFPNRIPEPLVVILPDHDPLTSTDLWQSIPNEVPIVVTAKDWVKLRDRQDVNERHFLIALQEVRLEPVDEFKTWVERRLNE